MDKVSKEVFIKNTTWKFMDVVSHKLIALVISVLLARLIVPEAYGIIALTTVFITFTDIFILNGFNIALIRKPQVDKLDYSTVTTMSIVFTSLMYVSFYLIAPSISLFYNSPELCSVLRVITLLLFFQSLATVVRAKATRELQFKKMAVSTFSANVSSGVIAVVLAYMGLGVWALVAQQLLANFLEMTIVMVLFKWHFSVMFSYKRAKEMFSFTLGVLGTSFLDFLGNNVCSLVIGKSFSTRDLGYYNRGNMFPETIGLNIYSAITSVLLPTLASYQNDNKSMKHITRQVMSLSLFVLFPLMFGLMGVANNIVPLLLTEKWIPCIPLMYFCCFSYAINPIRAIGYSVFYAKGYSELGVKVELQRATMMIIGLFVVITLLHGTLINVMLSNTIVSILIALSTHHYVKKCIDYNYSELFIDIFPSLLLSIMMMVVIMSVGFLTFSPIVLLILQIISGGLFYVSAAFILRNKNVAFLKFYLYSYVKTHFI